MLRSNNFHTSLSSTSLSPIPSPTDLSESTVCKVILVPVSDGTERGPRREMRGMRNGGGETFHANYFPFPLQKIKLMFKEHIINIQLNWLKLTVLKLCHPILVLFDYPSPQIVAEHLPSEVVGDINPSGTTPFDFVPIKTSKFVIL